MSSKPDMSANDAMIDQICEHLKSMKGDSNLRDISFERGIKEIEDESPYLRFVPDGSMTITLRMEKAVPEDAMAASIRQQIEG